MQIHSDLYDTQTCSPWFKTFERDVHDFPHRLGRQAKLFSLEAEDLLRGKDLGLKPGGERRNTWYWGLRERLGDAVLSLKPRSICSHEASNSQGQQNFRVTEETKAPSRLWIYLYLHLVPFTADPLLPSKSCPSQHMDEARVRSRWGPGPLLSLRSCWCWCHCCCYVWVHGTRSRVGGVWGSQKRVGVRWVWVGSGRRAGVK